MTTPTPTQIITARFFEDPEWKQVEDMILAHIEPLRDFDTIDLKQPAEHVKAEVIGRMLAYNSLTKFLQDTKLVNRPLKEFNNPFR